MAAPAYGMVANTAAAPIEVTSLSQDQIRQIQTALNSQGAQIKVDGVVGPQTTRAIQDFKSSKGIGSDEALDEQTLTALNLDPSTFRAAH